MTTCFSFLRDVSLRFKDKEEESAFKAHIETKLVLSTAVMSGVTALVGAIGAIPKVKTELMLQTRPDARIWCWTMALIYIGLSLVLSSCCFLRLRFGWLKFVNWEVTFTISTCVVVLSLFLGNQYTAAKLYGEDSSQIWVTDANGAEGALALTVDAINTVLCLFVPVRIHLKWIPAVFGVFSFCICFGVLGSPFPEELPVNIAKLVGLTFCALWGAWRAEKDTRQNYMAQGVVEKKSKELEVQHAGAFRILDRLCDSLVELDANFNILDPGPRLAAMLLRSQDLRGKSFCSLVASEDDQVRFVSALQDDTGSLQPNHVKLNSSMVQICLRDYYGRVFGVYVYHARTFGEEYGHMVAIVETQERTPPDALHSELVNHNFYHLQNPVTIERSCSSSSFSEGLLIEEHTGDVAVWINVVSPAFEILRSSAGFSVFGPIPAGASFLELVEDSRDFRVWVQSVINEKVAKPESAVSMPRAVRLRNSPQSNSEFVTSCTPDLSTFDWDDEADVVLLCLVFDQVKCRHRRRRSTPTRGLNSSSKGPLAGIMTRLSL